MDAGNVVIQEVVTLLEGEMNAHAADHLAIAFAALESTQKPGRKACAPGEFGDAFESARGSDRHDAGDDGEINPSKCATFAVIKEISVIEKELGDDVVGPSINFLP